MTDVGIRFYDSIENVTDRSQVGLVELFVYYLTVEASQDTATSEKMNDCFEAEGASHRAGCRTVPIQCARCGITFYFLELMSVVACYRLR